MRLIDADALLSDIERSIEASGCVNHEGEIMDCIRYASEVDAVPVVRGEWEDIPNRYVCVAGDRPYRGNATSCSVCHDVSPNAFKTNFCPNCGADMRKE